MLVQTGPRDELLLACIAEASAIFRGDGVLCGVGSCDRETEGVGVGSLASHGEWQVTKMDSNHVAKMIACVGDTARGQRNQKKLKNRVRISRDLC